MKSKSKTIRIKHTEVNRDLNQTTHHPQFKHLKKPFKNVVHSFLSSLSTNNTTLQSTLMYFNSSLKYLTFNRLTFNTMAIFKQDYNHQLVRIKFRCLNARHK